jgi:DNA polymerase III subunit delta'
MSFPIYFDPKKTLNLYGLSDTFEFLKNSYTTRQLPKVLMLSGKKGSGKSTLVNHLMYFIYDKKNYNEKTLEFVPNGVFYKQLINNSFSNIIYFPGSNYGNIKIEDVRNLKNKLYQTSISKKPRFIILDDVELFNINSLNALLKIIEEPSQNNYFLLINNKSKPLLETIKSRCLEFKIILKEEIRLNIINSLIDKFNINLISDLKTSQLTPGNLIKFNYIFDENSIVINQDYIKNLVILLNLFKKEKDSLFIDMILFLTDNFFKNLIKKNECINEKIIENKRFVCESINKFFLYNLNQNALINNISNIINNE